MTQRNWAHSTLGAPDAWPPALRSAIALCLDSALPMLVIWGPERALFFNQACRSIIGVADDEPLGKPVAEALPEFWDAVGPTAAEVLRSGEAAKTSYRPRCCIDSPLDFFLSPIREANGVGGLFCVSAERPGLVDPSDPERPQESDARVKIGASVVDLALAEIDYGANFFRLSAEAARMFGFGDEATLVARGDVYARVHPADRGELLHRIIASLDFSGSGRLDMDLRIVAPGREERWVRARKQVFFKGEGAERRPDHATVALVDVTAEKAASESVLNDEVFLRDVMDSMPQNVAVLDQAGAIVMVNVPWERFARENESKKHAAATGRNYKEACEAFFFGAEARLGAALEGIRSVLDGERDSFSLEYSRHAPDGVRWFSLQATRAKCHCAKVILNHADITGLKQAESSLRESEERLRLFIEYAPAAVAMFDRDMCYLAASNRWLSDFGLDHPIVGRSHYEVFPEIPDRWRDVHRRVLSGEICKEDEDVFERADGSAQWLKWEMMPWRRADGQIGGAILSAEDITRRKFVEEQHSLFVSLAEQSHEFIATCDLSYSLNFLNPAGLRMVGLASLAEARKMPIKEFFFPEDLPFVANEFFPRVLEEGRNETEIRFRNFATGEAIWMHYSLFKLTDRDGKPLGYASVSLNISEQRRAKQNLIETERRLQAVMRAAPIGLCYSSDPDCKYMTGNRALFSMFEMEDEAENISASAPEPNAPGRKIRFFGRGRELSDQELPLQHAAAEGREIPPEEIEVLLPSGRRWCAEISASPISDEGGRTLGGVAVVADITQRKRDADALRESEERFRAITELNPDAILVLFEGSYVYANPAAARLLGAESAEELIGLTPFDILDPPYHDLARKRIRLAIEEGRSDPLLDYSWRRRDGTPVEVEVATGPIKWRGKPAVQVVARDITLRRSALEALREADRCKDEFLATLAHELRNPLAPISNAMHILRKLAGADAMDKERKVALLGMMERQISHLVRLVDDLLEISRISRGKILLRKEAVDLSAILRDAIDTSRPLIDAAGLRLDVTAPREPMLLDADPTRLTQVFANLLNNAAKYTDAGGRIELTAKRRGDEAVVSVRDNGAGVPPEMLQRLFDLFTQVDRTLGRAQGGLGIGLALARKLVQLHGGEIEAHSEGPGQGSEFVVCLPLCRICERDLMSETATRRENLPPRRVLVIDDDHDVADSLVLLLETFGVTARAAYSGAQGLEMLSQYKPELVFLDLGMPNMNGYETAVKIRQHPEGRALTLVALSGWGQEEDVALSREAGFDDHLTKPADLEALEKLLERMGGS